MHGKTGMVGTKVSSLSINDQDVQSSQSVLHN